MDLAKLKSEKHFATVTLPNGQTLQAEFALLERETYLLLHSASEFPSEIHELRDLPGVLNDGTKISFLNLFPIGRTTFGIARNDQMFHMKFQPEFVVVGRLYVTSESTFKKLWFSVDDAHEIFYDFSAFGFSYKPELYIDAILADVRKNPGCETPRGEAPLIAYFGGRFVILSTTTALGEISASHRISHSMGGPSGIAIESEIFLTLSLARISNLSGAVSGLRLLLRFLEVVAGRRQNLLTFSATPDELKVNSVLEVYWPHQPKRISKGSKPSPHDLPINGGIDAENFCRVLAGWIRHDTSRRDARVRFSGCFSKQNHYDIDRLDGAANMYDILPPEAVPPETKLSPEMLKAKQKARQIFKALPDGPERSSILSALGRLGHNALKRKIQHRAEILIPQTDRHLPELILVTNEAVDCRNHYVHGNKSKIDYTSHLSFLTDTLEFVFAASEFVEIGWDFRVWAQNGTTMSHPWGTYVVTYADRLSRLKADLTGASA